MNVVVSEPIEKPADVPVYLTARAVVEQVGAPLSRLLSAMRAGRVVPDARTSAGAFLYRGERLSEIRRIINSPEVFS